MNETASLYYGPAGWSYQDWNGPVYPEKKGKGFDQLKFIAGDLGFDFVEVNTSFYRIPSLKLTDGWVNKTESLPDFKFWIKLYQEFTHERKVSSQDVRDFKAALSPLEKAGKLAGLLVQFPYSFKLNTGYLKYVLALADIFKEYTLALEFRHNSWVREEFFQVLREKNLIWVNIDQPPVSLSLPLTAVMTHSDTTYFRLHGRNEKSWFSNEGRDARYDYNYNALELNQIGQKIKELIAFAKKVFISGNNHYKGSAVKNLLELKKRMQEE
ncbi:MAG: DUF72 domain-containing protein [bacterium]|nr:DUF72 domain-containing protein [bacterium]